MEGALASLVGGLTGAPVVAVPTSVGYGASLEGVTALLAMLASCAAGLMVVGIDNGFGAACAVARILPTGSGGGRAMTTAAWWHCFAGIAGDMALGSLLDAGADLDEVRAVLTGPAVRRLGPRGRSRSCATGSPPPTSIVRTDETGVVRTHAHIAGLLTEARLPERVRRAPLATFSALAEVEGRLHRRPPAQVHFHELGGHRRHRRHRRHLRRPRGARRRPGPRQPGGHRHSA